MDDAETGKLLEGCACLIVSLTMQATALSQEAGWQGSDVWNMGSIAVSWQ